MLLHQIPREITSPFNLSDRHIKIIRAFRQTFHGVGVGIWYRYGEVIAIGFNQEDVNGAPLDGLVLETNGYIRWNEHALENWERSFDALPNWMPPFENSWITGIFHVVT